ncbi:MAG: Gfo/Idh/MocA family oxidoreductase [Kiritimatiellaeota bacterium]|nr:Gfo/Idh/MocA family oxidoreductase [Kiritimatiellota bacterium]
MDNKLIVSSGYSRRDFLRGSLLTAGAFAFGGCASFSTPKPRVLKPGEKLNLAGIGAGGKGDSDISEMIKAGMNVIALCDVDEITLNKKAEKIRKENNPDVRLYRDFREMLAKEPLIDACTISTPDHMHAPAASMAMQLGKHVYVQKPLTHTIWEARRLRELARKTGVVTQMGNQGSASNELRRGVEVIQAGVIGAVKEVHVWTNRPIWPQGCERPTQAETVPANLDWNLWLGVAPERPYAKCYQPFAWRGWYDFGTGALGDMACHTCNLPFRALNLGYATEVEAVTEGATAESFPKHAKISFQFPARANPAKPGELLPSVKFFWYEGGWKPDAELIKDVTALRGETPIAGCYFIGEKGRLFSAGDYGDGNSMRLNDEPKLRSVLKHEVCLSVPETIPRSKGGNYKEWADACAANTPDVPYSRFEIAAYLTEIILVGCIALRLPGKKIQWDGPNMRSPNTPEAEQFVNPPYRKGWCV